MKASKCDACGTVYESYKDEDNYKILRDEGEGVYRCETELDICPKCLKKIKDCIESGNKDEKEDF